MKANSIVGGVALILSVGAMGACTARIGGPGHSEDGMAVGDGIVEGDDDIDGDFEADQQGGGGDPDNPFVDQGPGYDFPGGVPPYEFPQEPPDDVPPPCEPAPEDCDNGVDDDCDDLIDETDPDCDEQCVWSTTNCSDVELIGHCNSHLGDDINACYAAGNPGNCGADELYAWCSRRVYDGPGGAWYNYIHDWVANRCNGSVHFQVINGSDYYWCEDAGACERWECKTPLVLVFEPAQSVSYHADDGRGCFDLSAAGDGSGVHTDWPTAATPWLALDRDGDGAITSGAELFGSATPMQSGKARNGFEPLRELDHDGNGVLDRSDPGFERLVLWRDANHDRVSQPGELETLPTGGIERIELSYYADPRCDVRGNCEIERASFQWRAPDGETRRGEVVDVRLSVHR